LNSEQRAAVEHGEGPLLIIAGPGTGKTRVITERIVHLLGGRDPSGAGLRPEAETRPENILALTFTNKAAWEMKSRVHDALPGLETSPWIATFHSFCNQVLAERNFDQQVLNDVDLWIFLRLRMRSLGLEHYRKLAEPGAFLHDLNEFFSRCQDELVEPDDFAAYVARLRVEFDRAPGDSLDLAELEKKEELTRVFRRSRELLEQAGCASFGSLISQTLRLWEREPELLTAYRKRFHYVLVDEFQDTNFAQVEILKRLVAPGCNITAVGDDDQAIYRFRGASSGAFRMFDEAFPGHRTIYLSQNYRSTRRILRASEAVIAKNQGRSQAKPPLRTENAEGPRVYLVESPGERSEAAWVADEVERLAARGTQLGDIAVLYRGHLYRQQLVRELRLRQIPFNIRGLSILRTPMARDLVAYLHLIHSPHHNISLTRVLLAPRWRFPEDLARDARRRASQGKSSLYTAIRSLEQTLFAADLRRTGWPQLEAILGRLRELAGVAPMTTLFDRLADGLGLDSLTAGPDKERVAAFRKFVEEWEKKHQGGSLAPPPETEDESPRPPLEAFMEYLHYFIEAGGVIETADVQEPLDAVQMMTVHAAKGLEFPVVFVLSVARQRFPATEKRPVIEFPDSLRKGPPAPPGIHLQEERRLFYVALTRARQRLYVSTFVKSGRKASVFVDDLLSDRVVEARDIERIRAPDVEDAAETAVAGAKKTASTAARGVGPAQVLLSERTRPSAGAQMSLFATQDLIEMLHPDLEEWARRPVREIAEPNKALTLSATAIETYRTCPLRFKFQHLLKIQTAPQGALTFGAVMHESVRYYFKLRQEGTPRFEDVELYFLRAWKDTGFQDDYHVEQSKRDGLDQLREFVSRQNSQPVPEQLVSEQGFSLEVNGVRVQGRIDQVQALSPLTVEYVSGSAKVPQGGETAPCASPPPGSQVELIDYKTGRPRTQKDAEKSVQLSVYALAAERTLGLRPSRLTFYNLTTNEAVSSVRTSKDLDDVQREIHEVAEAVREQRFEPTPGYACRHCDFAAICPTQEER
jgi:DNA helicase II / ATP-dependent DNA helicase PcrA